MWNCKNCRNQNEEEFNFCWSCGQPRAQESNNQPLPETPIERPKTPMTTAEPPKPKPVRPTPKRHPVSKDSEKVWQELRSEQTPIQKPPIGSATEKPPVGKTSEAPPEKPAGDKKASESVIEEVSADQNAKTPAASPEPDKPVAAQKTQTSPPNREPELFATFGTVSANGETLPDEAADWPRVIYIAAVRLTGFYLLFQVLMSLPELTFLIYTALTTRVAEGVGLLELIGLPLIFLAAKLLFYLIAGLYLVSSGRLFIRLLPR